MDEHGPGADDGSTADDRRTTRRRTLEGAAGIAAAGTIGGTGSVGADQRQTQRDDDLEDEPLVDAHCHLIPEETLGREPLSADDLVAWMDDNGIDRAVVLALDSPESYPVLASSPWILEQVEPYPERLLPFCTIDPRTLVYGEDAAEELLERYVERGARGFGELKAGVAIDDSRAERIYELGAEHELPILFHTDEKAMMDEVGLPRLEDVVASFPEVDFLAHAHGWWAHVATDVEEADLGDYPDGEIDEPGRVPELLERYDNLYGDLSGISGWNALTRDPAFGQVFLEAHSEQLIFGTDYIYPGQAVPQLELFDRFDLDRSAREAIRYRNLEDVLR
ncbi:amidohydrolase 2 [Natronococcus amylolyticus DSM 10524]|uniref:Amidohydrolase 2 n=1 Tax=Natronococcus amylolyticus DSM 10524 TaxID=1227497 RepID=L9X586_9EURY|nr:amidohydrolase family protein [Natronococcus amylolyticus]ELY56782.1 amidohydrolase 2 [Natronococcus amylolyticus DSM 10524]